MAAPKSSNVAWVGLLALSIAGVGSAAPAPAIPRGATYVAMGSSFAAGPGVSVEAADGLARCTQSRDNYARQVARRLGLRLVDRSCGGATTVHVLHGGQFGLPAQLDGLTADTALVTITIGGNDIRYMADLGVAGCANRPEARPADLRATACATTPASFQIETEFQTLAANMTAIAAEVRRRSPRARLIFVDYTTVLPEGASCPALPLTPAQGAELKARADRLAALTQTVATQTGADLIKASDLTRGHDACAAVPWVNGYVFRAAPSDWAPVAFHPLQPAMTAIAGAIAERLGG